MLQKGLRWCWAQFSKEQSSQESLPTFLHLKVVLACNVMCCIHNNMVHIIYIYAQIQGISAVCWGNRGLALSIPSPTWAARLHDLLRPKTLRASNGIIIIQLSVLCYVLVRLSSHAIVVVSYWHVIVYHKSVCPLTMLLPLLSLLLSPLPRL